jgi:NAD(P)H-dependent flavin oxidoreductase YrpB (nitropropane dioxygenase family)
VLDLKRRKPSLFQNCRVILAGGIFNRETAFIAAMLGADAIQMGTTYLATQEIVETGALTAL